MNIFFPIWPHGHGYMFDQQLPEATRLTYHWLQVLVLIEGAWIDGWEQGWRA